MGRRGPARVEVDQVDRQDCSVADGNLRLPVVLTAITSGDVTTPMRAPPTLMSMNDYGIETEIGCADVEDFLHSPADASF